MHFKRDRFLSSELKDQVNHLSLGAKRCTVIRKNRQLNSFKTLIVCSSIHIMESYAPVAQMESDYSILATTKSLALSIIYICSEHIRKEEQHESRSVVYKPRYSTSRTSSEC